MRSDVGRAGTVAETRRGTTTSARDLNRVIDSAADTDSHVSGDSSAPSTTANDASSSYCPSTRSASVRTRRSGSRTASRSRADVFARSTPASVTSAGARPRTAQKRTSADASAASSKSRGTAAGSRGRKSAHAARHRISASATVVQRRTGARSSRVVNRPIARSASPTTGAAAGSGDAPARYCARAVRAAGVRILPSAWAASRATTGGVPLLISNSDNHGIASAILQLTRGERHRRDDLDVLILARGYEKGLPCRVDDPPDRDNRSAPDLRMRRRQQLRQDRFIKPPHVLEHHQLRDGIDVCGRQRPALPFLSQPRHDHRHYEYQSDDRPHLRHSLGSLQPTDDRNCRLRLSTVTHDSRLPTADYFVHIQRRISGSNDPPCTSECAPSPHSCLTS